MTKQKRLKDVEEELEAIRNEPAFRALVEELDTQQPEQLDRLKTWLENQAQEEECDGCKETGS